MTTRSSSKEKRKLLDSSSGGLKKMESALNDWLGTIEDQVNSLQDQIYQKTSDI